MKFTVRERYYEKFDDLNPLALLASGFQEPWRTREDIAPEELTALEKCEVCGIEGIYDFFHTSPLGIRHRWEWSFGLFRGLSDDCVHELPKLVCNECARRMLPHLIRLRDVIELRSYVNLLGRSIHERRRAKDHGATT